VKEAQMGRFHESDRNFPNMIYEDYLKKVIEPLKKKSSVGFSPISRDFFEKQEKKIRNLTEIGYRLLNFIAYSFLFFSFCLDNITKEEMEKYLIKDMSILQIIETDWNLLSKSLSIKNINSVQIFMNIIFKKLSQKIKECKYLTSIEQREKFENEIEDLITEVIDNYDFNFFFESPEKGHLIIGQKPHEYDNNHFKPDNFIFTKIVNDNNKEMDWYLKFDNIYFGNEKLSTNKNILLRIEYGVINGNKNWQEIFEKNFFDKLIEEKKCFIGKGWNDGHTYIHYYCEKDIDLDSFQPVNFIINDLNFNITLTKDDLFIEKDNKLFFLIIFGHPQPVLGFPLFKKYQLIFNQDSKTVGLYSKINGKPSVPIPPSNYSKSDIKKPDSNKIIIFLLIIVIIMFSIYIIRRLLKSKRKNDLSNNSIESKLKTSEIQLVDYEKIDK
jgi:hypothetical protein